MGSHKGQRARRQPPHSQLNTTTSNEIVTSASSRPRTRAWTKKQLLDQLSSTRETEHQQPTSEALEGDQARSQQASSRIKLPPLVPLAGPSHPISSVSRQPERPSVDQEARTRSRLRSTERASVPARPTQSEAVDDWLNRVETRQTNLEQEPASQILSSPDLTRETRRTEIMQSLEESRVSTTPSDNSGTGTPSATGTDQTVKPKGGQTVTWDKLRQRRVNQEKTKDDRSEQFRSILTFEPTRIRFKDIGDLEEILRAFLELCEKARPDQDSYAAIEDLIDKFASWKPRHGLFSISNREFRQDTDLCLKSNEAVLQRTVMASLIDRWHLSYIFTFNCEGQWKTPDYPLPTSGPIGQISAPKPDLAVFFELESLTEDISAPIPESISTCLRPDGGQWRCFPFLFMEVKRARHDLDLAEMSNAHNASQALYNMYIWMELAGEVEDFLQKVRVFTIVLNARELALRCYRAELGSNNQMRFRYDDIELQSFYNRDQACKLIRKIMVEYAEKELYAILKATFQKVVDAFANGKLKGLEKGPGKRKAGTGTVSSGKRSRPSQDPVGRSVNLSDSFGASNLSIGSSGRAVGISTDP